MDSSRLPGKVMTDICGMQMLARVIQRVEKARLIDLIMVATSTASPDDEIKLLCDEMGIPCFRGSLHDVLDRYYRAAVQCNADAIVRITADCPLIDPLVMDKVIEVFSTGNFDYVSNTIKCTYPDGLDTEVFHISALERAWREARLQSEREHVTPYIYNHPELFRLLNVSCAKDLSELRWTVDEPPDLEFVRSIYSLMGESIFNLEDVLRLLNQFPKLSQMNREIKRNEGYLKSLQQDMIE